MSQVKLDQVMDPSKASPENGEKTTAALVAVDTSNLNAESLDILNQIIAAEDIDKTKDLTYLFNINQNKKTMVRMDKLSGLQDNLVDQFVKRITERPDEISNKELMDGLKLVQDIIERGQKQVAGVTETPLIQINQQTNSVNIGENSSNNLNRESREKVKNAVLSLLNKITKPNEASSEEAQAESKENTIIDAEVADND